MIDRRVIVTGSRTWTDRRQVWDALDAQLTLCDRLTVVWGKARSGADLYVSIWTRFDRRPKIIVPEGYAAEWGIYHKAAGGIRNTKMVSLGGDLCMAFLMPCMLQGCPLFGGHEHWTHGTWDCAQKAAAAGMPVGYFYDLRGTDDRAG